MPKCNSATNARPHAKRLQNFEGKKAQCVDPKTLPASTIQRYWLKRVQNNLTYQLIENYTQFYPTQPWEGKGGRAMPAPCTGMFVALAGSEVPLGTGMAMAPPPLVLSNDLLLSPTFVQTLMAELNVDLLFGPIMRGAAAALGKLVDRLGAPDIYIYSQRFSLFPHKRRIFSDSLSFSSDGQKNGFRLCNCNSVFSRDLILKVRSQGSLGVEWYCSDHY